MQQDALPKNQIGSLIQAYTMITYPSIYAQVKRRFEVGFFQLHPLVQCCAEIDVCCADFSFSCPGEILLQAQLPGASESCLLAENISTLEAMPFFDSDTSRPYG